MAPKTTNRRTPATRAQVREQRDNPIIMAAFASAESLLADSDWAHDDSRMDVALAMLETERERFLSHGIDEAKAVDIAGRLSDDETIEVSRRVTLKAFGADADTDIDSIAEAQSALRRSQIALGETEWLAVYVPHLLAVWASSGARHAYQTDVMSRNVPNLTKAAKDKKLTGVSRAAIPIQATAHNGHDVQNSSVSTACAPACQLPDTIRVASFLEPTLPYKLPRAADGSKWIHSAEAYFRQYAKAQIVKGSPLPHRMLMAMLIQLGAQAREQQTTRFVIPADEFLRWIYPEGNPALARDWYRMSTALKVAGELWVKTPDGMHAMKLLNVEQVPDALQAWHSGNVEVSLRFPNLRNEASYKGGRIHYDQLAQYGVSNVGAYRAYLSAQAVLDRNGFNGKGRQRGHDKGTFKFTADDLAAMSGLDSTSGQNPRATKKRGIAAFETLAADGIIDLEHDGKADIWRIWAP